MKALLVLIAIVLLSYGGYKANDYYVRKDAFFDAIRKGDIPEIEKLMKGDLGVDTRDGASQTPLHVAAYRGTPEVINYLLDHGANIEAKDRRGGRPIHWAAIKGKIDNVEALLNKGAKLNVQDDAGDTPLHWAAAGMGVLPVKKFVTMSYMLNQHADQNIKNNEGLTALDIAKKKNEEIIIRLLSE